MLHSSSPLSLPFSPEKPLDNSKMIYIFTLLIGRPKGAMPKSHTQVDARNAKIDTSSRLINNIINIRTKETQILRLKIRSSH